MESGFNRFFQWHYDTPLIFVRVTGSIAWRCIRNLPPDQTMCPANLSFDRSRSRVRT